MKLKLLLIFVLFFSGSADASGLPGPESKSFDFEFEGQILWQGRNDAAVPGDIGTRFSLRDVLKSPVPGYRFEFAYRLSDRHQLRAVVAPLTIKDTGSLTRPVLFQGANFAPGVPTEGVYQFNSYRLTYRYAFVLTDDWTFLGGLTLKLREAEISLRQGSLFQEKTNVGSVPLLYGALAYRFSRDWQAELEFDALAAPQGRAEDVRLCLRKKFPGSGFSAAVGGRILEGGADNDEVYAFSLFQYVIAGLAYEI
jgi:hypothetical protein